MPNAIGSLARWVKRDIERDAELERPSFAWCRERVLAHLEAVKASTGIEQLGDARFRTALCAAIRPEARRAKPGDASN